LASLAPKLVILTPNIGGENRQRFLDTGLGQGQMKLPRQESLANTNVVEFSCFCILPYASHLLSPRPLLHALVVYTVLDDLPWLVGVTISPSYCDQPSLPTFSTHRPIQSAKGQFLSTTERCLMTKEEMTMTRSWGKRTARHSMLLRRPKTNLHRRHWPRSRTIPSFPLSAIAHPRY
jgi:hypothetical protein